LNDDLAGGFTQLEPVRILIVDDFEPWRRAVCSILAEDADLEVVGESSDGLDAVQKSEELQPDIVLLDIQLPKMNGLDAARKIHKVSPGTKILFLSSYHSVEIMREALRIGTGFVVKADAARDLLPIVRAVVRDEPFVRFKFLYDSPFNPDEM
jgi:DNA-binding NarL/FixJ family response regulator